MVGGQQSLMVFKIRPPHTSRKLCCPPYPCQGKRSTVFQMLDPHLLQGRDDQFGVHLVVKVQNKLLHSGSV